MTPRLYATLVKQSLAETTTYRGTTILIVTFGLIFYAIDIIAGLVYFDFAPHVFGWTLFDYINLITSANIVTYGYQTLFVAAHEELADKINQGNLDYVLLRPINSYWFNVLYRVDFPSLVNLIIVIGVEVYLISQRAYSLIDIFLYSIAILLGIGFVFLINQIVVTLAFWVDNLSTLNGLPENIMSASARPAQIYPKVIRVVFLWLVPTLTATNLPIEILKEQVNWWRAGLYFVIIIGLWIVSYIEWQAGTRRYASAD